VRITGGELKGRRMKGPHGRFLRPTSEKVRKAIFDLLAPYDIKGKVLDLFAGSGALGFEALSRGAEEVVFVEKDKGMADLIKENLKLLGLEGKAKVLNMEAKKSLRVLAEKGFIFDLILMDPPYKDYAKIHLILEDIKAKKLLSSHGLVIFEHSSRETPPEISGWKLLSNRRYGDTAISIFILADEE